MDHIINLLQHKKQIILQGPPGTGKTYLAKNIAEKMIYGEVSLDKTLQKKRLQSADQFALVQFHPSFSYEDFVRGISAKSEGGKIIYETENKLLTTFAEKANYNIRSARIDPQELSREQLVEKILMRFAERIQVHLHEYGPFEITKAVAIVEVEEDAFRYAGIGTWKASQRMKFKDLIHAQLQGITTRQDLKNLAEVSGLAKVHASYYIKVLNRFQKEFGQELQQTSLSEVPQPSVQPYLLIIDEINRANLPAVLGELIYALEYRDEVVNSMYVLDGDSSLVLPENLYIVGTMNTADRSVGHIDYAIRRRFAFVDILPEARLIQHPRAKVLFAQVAQLFVTTQGDQLVNAKYLSPEFDYKEVQLGHSYFIFNEPDESAQREALLRRLNFEILPILQEYLRDGILLDLAKPEIEKIARFEY
ncbi:MAG: hypothetical protein Sapg2KO_45760 [Saprospiraceae bacterium]